MSENENTLLGHVSELDISDVMKRAYFLIQTEKLILLIIVAKLITMKKVGICMIQITSGSSYLKVG